MALLNLLFFHGKKANKTLRIDRSYIWLFMAFVFWLLLALVINNGFLVFEFTHRVLAFYLVGIVSFFSIDCFLKDHRDFDRVVLVFSLLVLLDSCVSILQFQNNPLGWDISQLFADVSVYSESLDRLDTGMGSSVLTGILGHPVANGFFIATCTPLLLVGLKKSNQTILRLYYLITIIIAVYTCYIIQQRAAFFLLAAVLFYHFSRWLVSYRKSNLFVVIILLLSIIIL